MPGTNDIYGAKAAAPLTNPTAAAVFLTQDSVTANAASSSTPTKAAVVYLPEVEVDSVNLGNNAGVKWPLGATKYNVRIAGRCAAGASTTATFALQLGQQHDRRQQHHGWHAVCADHGSIQPARATSSSPSRWCMTRHRNC